MDKLQADVVDHFFRISGLLDYTMQSDMEKNQKINQEMRNLYYKMNDEQLQEVHRRATEEYNQYLADST